MSVLAFAALHERPTPFGFAGIVLVSFGIMSLALRRGFRFSGESVPYALLTGVFIAAYSICDGIGARVAGSALGYVAWVYLLWSVPQILLVCAVRGGPRGVFGSRDAVRQGVVAGTISLVAYGDRRARVPAPAGRDRVGAARDELDFRGRDRLVRDARAARPAAARRVRAGRRGGGADPAVIARKRRPPHQNRWRMPVTATICVRVLDGFEMPSIAATVFDDARCQNAFT